MTGGFKRAHGAFRMSDLALIDHGSHYGFIEQGVVLRLKRDYLKPGVKKDYPTEDFPSSFFTSDVALYDTWNGVYRGYFTKEFPARAFIGSGKLLFGAHFEIQGIAVKR